MTPQWCRRFALGDLAEAQRACDRGQWHQVPGQLGAAICWTVAHWLLLRGHDPDHGQGWASAKGQFRQLVASDDPAVVLLQLDVQVALQEGIWEGGLEDAPAPDLDALVQLLARAQQLVPPLLQANP